jgi:hypothetical protein
MCIATLLARGQVTSHVSNQSLSKSSPPSPGILAIHRLDKRELSAPKLRRFDPYSFFHFAFAFTCETRFQNSKVDRRSKYGSAFRRGKGTRTVQRIREGISLDRGFADPRRRLPVCALSFLPSRLSRVSCALGRLRAQVERCGHIEGSCSRHARHEGESQILKHGKQAIACFVFSETSLGIAGQVLLRCERIRGR